MTRLALIPARAGSERLPGKNTRSLGGTPLILWTLEAACESGCYDAIAVCTDDDNVRSICRDHPHLWTHLIDREPVDALEPDIAWVVPAVEKLGGCDTFSILRPTSPFRSAETIRRAWKLWEACDAPASNAYYDSLRAVRLVREYPLKMWRAGTVLHSYVDNSQFVEGRKPDQVWNMPSQSFDRVFVQTAGLEIARSRVLPRSISGEIICPLILEGPEALDINTIEDWAVAEYYLTHTEFVTPDRCG